jgi:hypothetical protein
MGANPLHTQGLIAEREPLPRPFAAQRSICAAIPPELRQRGSFPIVQQSACLAAQVR